MPDNKEACYEPGVWCDATDCRFCEERAVKAAEQSKAFADPEAT